MRLQYAAKITFFCDMNFSNYPFDIQVSTWICVFYEDPIISSQCYPLGMFIYATELIPNITRNEYPSRGSILWINKNVRCV